MEGVRGEGGRKKQGDWRGREGVRFSCILEGMLGGREDGARGGGLDGEGKGITKGTGMPLSNMLSKTLLAGCSSLSHFEVGDGLVAA